MKKIKSIAKYVILSLVLFFIVKNIMGNYEEIRGFNFEDIKTSYLLVATVFLIYANIFPVFAWKYLLGCLGGKISIKKAMRAWFVANAGRYLPGKVWQIAGIVYLCEKEGIAKKISFQSMIYSQFTASYLGVLFLFILFKDMLKSQIDEFYLDFAVYLILFSSLVIFIPGFLKGLLNFLLKLIKKEQLEADLKFKQILIYVLLQLLNWINIGITFYLFVMVFTPLSLSENPETIFILPAAWTVGLLAVFVPGGIGIREGLLTIFLTGGIGSAFAVIIPWMHRIWITVVEALFAVGFYFLKRD